MMIVQKLAYILALLGEEEWFWYLFSVLRKISYKLGKIGKKYSIGKICSKKPERKHSTPLLALNVVNRTLVQITKTWTPYLLSVLRYRSSSMQELIKFLKTQIKYLMTVTSLHPCCLS